VFAATADFPDRIAIPKAGNAVLVERLLWVFMMSFAFDYRTALTKSGGGLDQMLFLALCVSSSLAILWLGRHHLLVRPGGWLLGFWGIFLAWMMANSFLQGVEINRSIRVALPLFLCFFAMANAHIAGCMGIRPAAIVRPVLAAACINVLWRIFHGFVFQEASVETVRFEVQSPANNWLAAWIGCAILLRGRFHWSLLAACGTLFIGIFITVTRSLFFPVIASVIASGICFVLGVMWRQFGWGSLWKRLTPVAAVMALALFALGAAALVQPVLIERWSERLFHNAASQNLGADISYLTRKAEADAIWTILSEKPIHFIHGHGFGCTYYWDPAYMPEISLVLPTDEIDVDEIWNAGHSMWTYGLLSGGVIGLIAVLVLVGSTASFSLIAARANSTDPGPDQWLAFLPFIATCCLLSESLTANPFQERLAGILFGMMAGLSQSFMVRASWLHTSTRQSNPLVS
jgi:hypothetical protein